MELINELIGMLPATAPALAVPTDLNPAGAAVIAAGLNTLLADVFALYLKTKNFHWHVSGPNFRDYHLLFDEQADQIYAMTDPMAERVRKLGQTTLHSIGQIASMTRVQDNNAELVDPVSMLTELMEDNRLLKANMLGVHETCAQFHDVATASQLEIWIDETERRVWFLFEAAGSPSAQLTPEAPEASTITTDM